MSQGLSDQRVAAIVLGLLLLVVSLLCFSFPWLSAWANARNARNGKTVEYRFWAPWRSEAETRVAIQP